MSEILSYIPPLLFGWFLSWVINYLADVLPLKRKLINPFCFNCKAPLPIINYLFYKRCNNCGKRQPIRVILVEIVMILISVWFFNVPPAQMGYWVGLIVVAYFCLVCIIDLEHRLIIHNLSIFGFLLFSIIGSYLHGIIPTLIGGCLGFIIMWGLYWLGIGFVKLLIRLKKVEYHDKEGLGFGDVILSGVIGLILGWPGITIGILLAIIIAGIVNLVYLLIMIIIKRYSPFLSLPYGPYLVISAALLLFGKNSILVLL